MTATTGVIRLERDGPAGKGLEPMELDPADFDSDLPEQTVHVYHSDDDIGLTVGVWTTTGMREKFGPYPGDEFMVVLEGRVSIVDGKGGAVTAEAGQSFMVRNAIPVSWQQEGFLRKFFITLLDPKAPTPEIASAEGGVIVLDPDALEARMTPEPEPAGGGTQRNATAFTNDAGTMTVGMWETTAFETVMKPYSVHEFCQILDGEMTISEPGGQNHRFGPGDVFFVPKGTVCSWKCDAPVRKYYAIVDAG